MGGESGRTPRIVRAEDIRTELLREEPTQETAEKDAGRRLLPLSNATVVGELDLRNLVIEKPVEIRDCDFEEWVDLRYCEFKQVVDFSQCTFHKGFNSGDGLGSRTIYRKNLICSQATFEGTASFSGASVEGGAYLTGAHFLDQDNTVTFLAASFGSYLHCDDAVFKGPVFLGEINCGGSGLFRRTRFEYESIQTMSAYFALASFGVSLDCSNATFKGPASFNSVKCGDSGLFRHTQFECESSEVTVANFDWASFDTALDCSDATFKGPASFSSVECDGSGQFQRARFENESTLTNFGLASFSAGLDCSDATFKGSVSFNSLKCGGSGHFQRARFENETALAEFALASFGVSLVCSDATFRGPASFNSVECDGSGHFQRARFENENATPGYIDFAFSHWGSALDFNSAYFAREVTFENAHMQGSLGLIEANFGENVYLSNVTMVRFILGSPSPTFEKHVYLAECSFERFHGTKEEARSLIETQDPASFSRDPYLQLEKYYSNVGDEVEARRMYFEGRYARLRDATRTHGNTKWSWSKKVGDSLLLVLTGYGVRTRRLLVPVFLFLFLGMVVFWPDDALEPKATSASAPPNGTLIASTTLSSGEEQDSNEWIRKLFHRLGYNLDLFLPVNLHLDDQWEPNGSRPVTYAFVHSMVGWLLIPLLLASLSGIIRRE